MAFDKLATIPFGRPQYPALLKHIPNPPQLLYVRGMLHAEELCVAAVGTRRNTPYGIAAVTTVLEPLVKQRITLVSGLAYGIDAAVHQLCINSNARTIAVIAGGLDEASIYPAAHAQLAKKIIACGGALISEYPPGTPAYKAHFIARNRIIAGLSMGTIVVECPMKSGALITARFALEYNRSVYAVPGSIYSKHSDGPNHLIKMGALPVTTADDITTDLRLPRVEPTQQTAIELSATEKLIVNCIGSAPTSIDTMVEQSKLDISTVNGLLTDLEIRGIIQRTGLDHYIAIKNCYTKPMPKYLKIILAILFLIAAALGLLQRNDKLLGVRTQQYIKEQPAQGDQSPEYFYATAQSLNKNQPDEVTFLAGGDIMLSRNVAAAIAKAKDPLLPFKGIETLLQSTDFNFANLESPFSGRNDFPQTGSLIFNAPTGNLQGLKEYNFQIVNLANNHAMDQGKSGLDFTQRILDENNILHVGTGSTPTQAWQPKCVTSHDIKTCFIGASYSSLNDGGKARNQYVARIEDTELLRQAITQAKSQLQADFIIVTMHAGTEYTRTPNASQVTFAHAAIDAGADMVIGAHPHWIQTTEQYQGKYIFYSLGNLVFDQEWSQDTKEGLTLKISLTKQSGQNITQLQKVEYVPIILERYCCARLATEPEKQTIYKKIGVTEAILK